ncbi:hypothetical protein ACHHYP_12589 [Achlya hypogyna]|uniref:Protein ZIP4 homolog n=1 Tax=Achlya hypogyna TaxID=1202772 RepID=A0A1V9YGM7_ACHHY|nr:hypothetical protein ACHHYP_12589 [Achlya hypogyna]
MDVGRLARYLDGVEDPGLLMEVRTWLGGPLHGIVAKDAIGLYNKSRACRLLELDKDAALQARAAAVLLMKRMGTTSLDAAVDLLRCFGRLGRLLLSSRCNGLFPIASPETCFEEAIAIYKTMGVHKLAKVVGGTELEAVLEEVYAVFAAHLRVLERSRHMLDVILEHVQELRMILPYLPKDQPNLAKLVLSLSDDFLRIDEREAEVILLAIALEILELGERRRHKALQTKVVGRLFEAYLALGLLEKAEVCLRMLGAVDGLLFGVKLALKRGEWTTAANLIEKLQNAQDFEPANEATRLFARATDFSPTAMECYQKLQHNFPEAAWDIDVDIASELAFSDNKELRQQAVSSIERIVKDECSPEQLARLKKVIHDGSCNAHNYNNHAECFQWARVGLIASTTHGERACALRLMALAKLKLGEFDDAAQYAHDAVQKELSKKSLFACFRAALVSPKAAADTIPDILVKLIQLDDFDVYDLVSFAKEAHEAGSSDVVLRVLDQFARMLVEHIEQTGLMPQLPMGVLFQNMAQLNNRHAECSSDTDEDTSITTFMQYLRDLLRVVDKMSPAVADTSFGPPAVFEWFYGVCHNLGCNKEDWKCFLMAATLAVKAENFFPNQTKLKGRETKCWLASICIRMKGFQELSDAALRELLTTIELCQMGCQTDGEAIRVQDYLATSAFQIKIRLNDARSCDFIEKSLSGIQRTPTKLRELGGAPHFASSSHLWVYSLDFVLVASKQFPHEGSVELLRPIASQLYKLSLQMELQNDKVDPTSVTYPLKKIIALAQSKEEGYEWLHQARQIAASLDISLPDNDVEWLLAKAWNFGVSCYRSQDLKQAEKFMMLSLASLEQSSSMALKQAYQDKLQGQYSKLVELTHSHAA